MVVGHHNGVGWGGHRGLEDRNLGEGLVGIGEELRNIGKGFVDVGEGLRSGLRSREVVVVDGFDIGVEVMRIVAADLII